MTQLLVVMLMLAQSVPPQPKPASISGTVKDPDSGAPVEGAMVMVNAVAGKRISATTGVDGRYRLDGLPGGTHGVFCYGKAPATSVERMVRIVEGEDLAGIDLALPKPATVTGRVLDRNKEPVPGVQVLALMREYTAGVATLHVKSLATTNDVGEYALERLAPGSSFWLLAQPRSGYRTAISDSPLEPKLRKAAYAPTFYPGVAEADGGVPLVLRAGETREGIDIPLERGPAYCIAGQVYGAPESTPANFAIAGSQFRYGMGGTGGVAMMPPQGRTGADGKFRVCELRPGSYRITAYLSRGETAPPLYATVPVEVTRSDVGPVQLHLEAGSMVRGSIAWAGDPPDPPVTTPAVFGLRSLDRGPSLAGEPSYYARETVPATFAIGPVLAGEYSTMTVLNAPNVYLKDVSVGGASVRFSGFRVPAAGEVHVVYGTDGGKVQVKATGKEDKPAADVQVMIYPRSVANEGALSAQVVRGRTDQDGLYTSPALEPGKYFVIATEMRVDHSADRIARLWSARSKAKEVEIPAKGMAQVTVEAVDVAALTGR